MVLLFYTTHPPKDAQKIFADITSLLPVIQPFFGDFAHVMPVLTQIRLV